VRGERLAPAQAMLPPVSCGRNPVALTRPVPHYSVADEMIGELEALLVRAFPNDLLNKKMEKLGEAKKKTKILLNA
jgi:hypothetical protein